jgi:hypothetical protein
MGFITVEIVGGAKPVFVQLSDSKLTLKRVLDVIGISTRRVDLATSSALSYCDVEGDWVTVGEDAELVHMFAAAKTVSPAKLQVIIAIYTQA